MLSSSDDAVRERSGDVKDGHPLVLFLYLLMRDMVTPGEVEMVMDKVVTAGDAETRFTNGWLARHAQDLALRLTRSPHF